MSLLVVLLLMGAPLLLVFSGPAMAQDNVVSVTRTQAEITIDGHMDEDGWSAAIPATIEVTKGTTIDVELRALYDAQYVYFFIVWDDPSKSVVPQQWQITSNTWFSAPHKEDRLAFMWNTADAIVGFEQNQQGCSAACHNDVFKTQSAAEKGDLWEWLAGRTNPSTRVPDVGWMDDMSIGSEGVVPDDFTGSKVWEANSMFAHDTNGSTVPFTAGDVPKWMEGNPPPNPDPDGLYLFRGFETDIIDPLDFPDGTNLPGYLLSRPSAGQDRADIDAKGVYDDTKKTWNLEIKRKLITESDDDVQFQNLLNSYHFGLAVFDNQGKGKDTHFRSSLVTLRFDVPELNLLTAEPSSTTPIVGEDINLTVHLKNMGGYSTGFSVAMYLDDLASTAIASKPYDELGPSAEDEFNFTWDTTGVVPGKHIVYVKVDADDLIPEHDENNNVVENEIWVYPLITSFKANKKEPEEGQKVKFTATVENPSDEEINVTLVFMKGEDVLESRMENVSAQSSLDVVFEWKATKEGKHVLKVLIDGAINTEKTFTVNVKAESPGPGLLLAAVAIALAAGLAVSRRDSRGG